jgi:hypothetical protein
MLKFAYYFSLFISIAASVISAYYWYMASKVEVDLRYLGMPGQLQPPVVDPGQLTLQANVAAGAATKAFIESSYWNKKAAVFAAVASIAIAGYSLLGFVVGH